MAGAVGAEGDAWRASALAVGVRLRVSCVEVETGPQAMEAAQANKTRKQMAPRLFIPVDPLDRQTTTKVQHGLQAMRNC